MKTVIKNFGLFNCQKPWVIDPWHVNARDF